MIILGWGKKGKRLAYIGLFKCQNCKNYGHFYLDELANKVSVYFIPVAKFNKKYYLVCAICDAAIEATETEKDAVLRESIALPPADTIATVWAELDQKVANLIPTADTGDKWDEGLALILNEMKVVHPPEVLGYVYDVYMQQLYDEDRAK